MKQRAWMRACLIGFVAFAFAIGCSSSDLAPPPTNGVNDVRLACDIRMTWSRRTQSECSQCVAYTTTPKCDCNDYPTAGRCYDQALAKDREATCEGVALCVELCKTDCACVDNCYAAKEACRKLASAEDGCVAELCADRCR